MTQIRIQFSRFSAFYSPLLATIACGFLKEEGLEGVHSVSPDGVPATKAAAEGDAEVVQSAISQTFGFLARGETPPVAHFAQINETDGFFLAGREPDPDFNWQKLAGKSVIADHGGQPLAMFKYACKQQGLDYAAIDSIDAGNGEEMEAAFRSGTGDYIHLQGPAPQQIEADGAGHVVASVGRAIGPVAFSTLAAHRDWLATDMCKAFLRSYTKSREYVRTADPAEIAEAEQPFFPGVGMEALTKTIGFYQTLGCWTPHLEIRKAPFETAIDVFLNAGIIDKRLSYDDAVTQPPAP